MKIVLLKPPKFNQIWAGVPDVFNDQSAHVYPPMGIMQLSSYLKAHTEHEIHLLDAVPFLWSYEKTLEKILELRPDVVGITTTTHGIANTAIMARLLKKADSSITVIIGGSHVSAFPEHALAIPELDYAIRGDGEEPLKYLLERISNGENADGIAGVIWRRNGEIIDNGVAEPIEDLDSIPLPDREGLPIDKYYTPANAYARTTTIMSSRGCPNNCVFCNVPHKFRARSASHVVDEMEECEKRYGIQEVHFIDDIFNISTKRVMEISEEILRRNLNIKWGFKASCKKVTPEMLELAKRAGCFRLHYGVESYSNEGLKALEKNITIDRVFEVFRMTREAGLTAIAYMIVGCPHEKTPDEVRRIKAFIRKLDPDFVVYSLLSPYPDTVLFQKGVEIGLWKQDGWIDFMRNPQPGVRLPTNWTEHMDENTLLQLFKEINRAFYFNPKVLWRTLKHIKSLAHLRRLIRGGASIMKLQLIKPETGRI